MAFSPAALQLIATASDDCPARLWRPSGDTIAEVQGHNNAVLIVAFGGVQGSVVATGSCDHTVGTWATATGQQQAVLKGHDDTLTSVRFISDSHLVRDGICVVSNMLCHKI